MDREIVFAFVNNALVTFGLFIVLELGYIIRPRLERYRPVVSGMLVSGICLAAMAMPYEVSPGLVFDTRTILVSVTGLIFGAVPTLMVTVTAAGLRILAGGAGMPAAVLSILFSAGIGLVWRHWVIRDMRDKGQAYLKIFLMGWVVHIGMILFVLSVPDGAGPVLAGQIAGPALLVYPVTSFLLSILLLHQRARHEAGNVLLAGAGNLQALFENLPISCQSLDETGTLIRVSRKWLETMGYESDEVIGRWVGDLMYEADRKGFRDRFQAFLKAGTSDTVITLLHKEGRPVTFSVKGRVIRDERGRFLHTYCALHNITQFRTDAEALLYKTRHDPMTGLYNREHFDAAVRTHLQAEDFPLTVIIGDIDGLKQTNDTFGRQQGDRQIRTAGRILSGCLREGEILARTGGDEFSILLPRTERATAYARMREMEDAFLDHAENRVSDELPLFLSLAYGTQEDASGRFEQAIREAEDYLYQRKVLVEMSPHNAVMKSIITTMNEKSYETEAHAERLVRLTGLIGIKMGLDSVQLDRLHLFSIVHDIGKVVIPDTILNKPGRLTDEEWTEMRRHPEVGYRITSASPGFSGVADLVLAHHERWDGGGYPNRLAGEAIPLLARILSVADAFDAMTAERPYRKPVPVEEAVEEIERCAGTQFDPEVALVFVGLVRNGELDAIAKTLPI